MIGQAAGAGTLRNPADWVGALAAAIRPPRKVTVSEAAELHRKFRTLGVGSGGSWSNAKTPYLVEIQNRMTSRAVSVVVVVGPSQFGKSELLLNTSAHAILYRPADILLVLPTQVAVKDFMIRRVSRMLADSPDIGAELGAGRSDDTVYSKVFRSGMQLDAVWPTATNLSSKPVPLVLLDERDRMPNNVDGEGDPVELARRRTTRFGKEGKVLVISSPSKEDGTGIVPLFYAGDQNLWAWPCHQCGEYFTPGFDAERKPTSAHLYIPTGATPEEARTAARVVCPACGFPHSDAHKAGMMERGTWLPRGVSIDAAGILHGAAPANRIASYWLHGLGNPFKPWGDLAAELVEAEREFENTGEETKIKAVTNTVLGLPYQSRAGGKPPVAADQLRRQSEGGHKLGFVPDGARFLTASVDTQGWGWEVAVYGWREDGEGWLVDRYSVKVATDSVTELDPATHPEHWLELLPKVFRRRWPLAADPSRTLGLATTCIDTGGVDGVSENAKAFWRAARKDGIPEYAITMIKGHTLPSAPPLARPSYELVNGKPNLTGYRWYMVGSSALKDIVTNRLHRKDPGPAALHLPHDLAERYLDELAAEHKVNGKWEKKRRRNETLDLTCYGVVGFLRVRPARVDWRRPPEWARALTAAEIAATTPAPAGATAAASAAPSNAPAAPAPRPAPAVRPSAPARSHRPGGFVMGWK